MSDCCPPFCKISLCSFAKDFVPLCFKYSEKKYCFCFPFAIVTPSAVSLSSTSVVPSTIIPPSACVRPLYSTAPPPSGTATPPGKSFPCIAPKATPPVFLFVGLLLRLLPKSYPSTVKLSVSCAANSLFILAFFLLKIPSLSSTSLLPLPLFIRPYAPAPKAAIPAAHPTGFHILVAPTVASVPASPEPTAAVVPAAAVPIRPAEPAAPTIEAPYPAPLSIVPAVSPAFIVVTSLSSEAFSIPLPTKEAAVPKA